MDKPFRIPGLQDRPYSEQELDDAFAMIDLDRHGHLDDRDVRRILDLCGESEPSNEEVLEMIKMLDPEGCWKVKYVPFRMGFTDPPLLFRNWDLNRKDQPKEGYDRAASMTETSTTTGQGSAVGSHYSAGRQDAVDQRGMAVAEVMGDRRLQPDVIRQVYQRFVEIDTQDSGFVSFQAFCLVLRRQQTEAMRRAFDVFDVDNMGELDLRIFIVGLALYSMSSDEDKLRFIFMMFDEEQHGCLSDDELADAFKALVPFLPAYQRDAHMRRMFSAANLSRASGVPVEIFTKYIKEHRAVLLPASASTSSKDGSSSGTPQNQSGSGSQSRPTSSDQNRGMSRQATPQAAR